MVVSTQSAENDSCYDLTRRSRAPACFIASNPAAATAQRKDDAPSPTHDAIATADAAAAAAAAADDDGKKRENRVYSLWHMEYFFLKSIRIAESNVSFRLSASVETYGVDSPSEFGVSYPVLLFSRFRARMFQFGAAAK